MFEQYYLHPEALAAMAASGFNLSHQLLSAGKSAMPTRSSSPAAGDFLMQLLLQRNASNLDDVVTVMGQDHSLKIAVTNPGSSLLVSSSLLLCLSAILLLLNSLYNIVIQRPADSWKLPPGPKGHFLLGSLSEMEVDMDGSVQRWSKEYGPVFTVWLGFLPTIFITRSKEARQLLVTAGSAFASRPHRKSRVYLTNNHRNINTSPYGPRWRALRRNLIRGVLSSSSVAAAGPLRSKQLEQMVSKLRRHAQERPEEAVPVLDNVLFAGFSVLLTLCFGQTFDDETVVFFREALRATLKVAGPNLGDFLPFVHRFINPAHYRRCKEVRDKARAIMLPIIEQHRERRRRLQPASGGDDAAAAAAAGTGAGEDYVDTLLAAQERQELDLDDDDMLLLCNELLNAGTETSANTIEFAMAELVRLPELQNRLAHHIQSVCGDRPVCDTDLPHLPFLRAVVLEALRLHPPSNYTLIHAATEDTTFCGFQIPRRAEILVSVKAVSMDSRTWCDPERFHPDRFMDGPPVDITGARGDKFSLIPFGAGRRICPGINVAMLKMQHTIGRLVQAFHWLPAKEGQAVDMSPLTLFTVKMLNPLQARIRPRISS